MMTSSRYQTCWAAQLTSWMLLVTALLIVPSAIHGEQLIAGYKPAASVVDHATIDLDLKLMHSVMTGSNSNNLPQASLIYQKGAHSKSYASVTLQNPTGAIDEKTAFVGTTILGHPTTLYAYSDYKAGETELKLRYLTKYATTQDFLCQVGEGNLRPTFQGCLPPVGTIRLEGIKSSPLEYTYNPETENQNGRTLAGFSIDAEAKMGKCGPQCPYVDYAKYLEYYGGTFAYGHEWIMAAFEQRQTTFGTIGSNVDFSTYSMPALHNAIVVATITLNVWMYVVREFEDALDDCNSKCENGQCNADKVDAWDEGIAFYTGSLEGKDGSGDGVMLYALADNLCQEFKTCGPQGNAATGLSFVNHKVFELSDNAVKLLEGQQCAETRVYKQEIVGLMTVPLVQGTLRAAYQSIHEKDETVRDAAKGEASAFAAALIPILHNCSATDASLVQEQLAYTANDRDYSVIKEALEKHFECMGVTCEQVGGLWDPENNTHRPGAAACVTANEESSDTWKIALGVGLGTVAVILVLFALLTRQRRKSDMIFEEK